MENLIHIEVKAQTIYFETGEGQMTKYHHISEERLNLKSAEEVLKQEGFSVNLVLRTVTERVKIGLTKEQLNAAITSSERFYKSQNE